jgi:hypothetical protein
MRHYWARFARWLESFRFPILSDLLRTSWPNWRESLKEVFVTLFFSLMPLWLGLLIVRLLTITDGTAHFIEKFASSSDLGILSASLLGPMLYMMFREEDPRELRATFAPRFPSGLWFTMATVACCMVATAIYCFTYVSGLRTFFDKQGSAIAFVNGATVASVSWILFSAVTLLLLCGCTIRNAVETRSPGIMREDTGEFVSELTDAVNDADDLAARMTDDGEQPE